MEIEFKHINFSEEPVFSKIVFTDFKINCTTIYPWRERKPELSSDLQIGIEHLLIGSPSQQISCFGEVNIASLKSVQYIYNSTDFSLILNDNENNSLYFIIHAGTEFYNVEINELIENLTRIAYPRIINSILRGLNNSEPTKIDSIELYLNGISLDWNRIFRTDKILVSWNRLNYQIYNSKIVIKEYNSLFIKSEIWTSKENVCLMPYIIDIMKKSNY